MNEKEENFDDLLLDNGDDSVLDSLPETNPFAESRPKKPWIMIGAGLVIILVGFFVFYKIVLKDTPKEEEIVLDVPALPEDNKNSETEKLENAVVIKEGIKTENKENTNENSSKQEVKKEIQKEIKEDSVQKIEDRKEIKFDPTKENVKKSAVKEKLESAKTVNKQKNMIKRGSIKNWYVQFGSYSTKKLAEKSEENIKARHVNLFNDKTFVILAAVLPNGSTTYRLRIGFDTMKEANSFCVNAKSDGLDCYVTK